MTVRTTEQILADIRDALQGVDPRGYLGTKKVARHGNRLLFRVRELDQWVDDQKKEAR